MKRVGFLLFFLGIVGMTVGGFLGCGTLFTWNGRHPIAQWDLVPGTPMKESFSAERGRRYTAAVQIVFDRSEVPQGFEGAALTTKLALVAAIVDGDGTATRAIGWIDPTTPPTVVYGRNPQARAPVELTAERLIGPWNAPRTETARIEVDARPDASDPVRPIGARVVLYDDAKPAAIVLGAAAAAVGAASFLVGAIALFFSRSRRGGKRVSRSINVRAT